VNRKNAVILGSLVVVVAVAWAVMRSQREVAHDSNGDRTAVDDGDRVASSSRGSGDDRMRTVKPPIHIGSTGMEPDIEAPAEAPTPAVIVDAAPHPSLDDEFVAEKRDAGWASEHEHEIKKRLAALAAAGAAEGIALESTECRARQCRITFTAGDETAIGRYAARLEEDGGLYGYAHLLVLEGMTTTPSGQRRERIYARFD